MLYCGMCGNEDVHVEHPLFLECPGRLRPEGKGDFPAMFFPERRASYAI
jgi:hypothetical protein